jgi:hypothetical protein
MAFIIFQRGIIKDNFKIITEEVVNTVDHNQKTRI